MRPRVNRLFAAWAARGALASAVVAAFSASAQETAPTGSIDARWIPSFAITSGVFWGRQHAAVSSDCRETGSQPPAATSCNPEVPEYGPELREGANQDELAATPYVGGNLSLETPVLARIGRPRLFASFELPYQFGIDRNVAQKERPTGISEPDNPEAGETLDEGSLTGVGSRTRSEVQGLTFGAMAGVAFSFEAFGREFHVKPSVNWIREEVGLRGRVEHGICRTQNFQQLCDLDGQQPGGGGAFTRVITLKGKDDIWMDGIGPGLDLEMETGRFGPYTVALFGGGGGYYLLGDRSVAFDSTRTIGPDELGGPVDYHAHWSWRASPWLYRFGLGVRLSWVGYD
jgi:hypothetical protein